jgi:hypothetical protein
VGFVELALLYQTLYPDFHFTSRRLRYQCRLLSLIRTSRSSVLCIHSLCFNEESSSERLQSVEIGEYYITLALIDHPYLSNRAQLVVSQEQSTGIQCTSERVSGHLLMDALTSLYNETSSPFTPTLILPREAEPVLD